MKLERNFNEMHNTYVGIYESDFNTEAGRTAKTPSWADRIAADWRFDEQCHKNIEARNRRKEDKNA